MRMVDLIARKRNGGQLTTGQINFFISEYTAGKIPDYQASAMLMAIYLQGLSRRETVDLTMAMANSGETLDLHDIAPRIVDKHSTGGVGDKTSLTVLPLVAAAGAAVGKMSGRGLGFSGGTLDKMESFDGWSSDLSLDEFRSQLDDIGLVLAGQTADLAPADGKLYALRDVTATVSSKPLIAGSIMSKKLAAGADAIVLDVKAGSGAFMTTIEDAIDMANIMVKIGQDAGRDVVAVVSDMNQPLGYAVGNALEVKEALDTLRGGGPPDLWEHTLEIGSHMLVQAGIAESLEEAQQTLTEVRDDGRGLARFREMVAAQGGDVRQVDNPDLLPQAEVVGPIEAPRSGYIEAMDTAAIGWATVGLGCGRLVKTDDIDYGTGLILTAKTGDYVEAGQVIGEIHARNEQEVEEARRAVIAALDWSDEPVAPRPLFHAVLGSSADVS